VASTTNAASSASAVSALTNGTGSAVEASITNIANSSAAVSGATNGAGAGVYGRGGSGVDSTGVYGTAAYGVYGNGGTYGVYGYGQAYGVYGTDTPGYSNTAVGATLRNASNPSPALQAVTAGTGSAVEASITNTANSSTAVSASTKGTGNALSASITNSANTNPAVLGSTKGRGSGVYGESTKAGGRGTTGQGTNGATGDFGLSDSGTGIYAKSATGDALQVVGKVAFSRSGLVTIAAKKKIVTVTLAGVTTSSMILATLQSNAGSIAVANAVPGSGSFTINLTAAHSSSVKVTWFVIG
jgi:hypothetical protein